LRVCFETIKFWCFVTKILPSSRESPLVSCYSVFGYLATTINFYYYYWMVVLLVWVISVFRRFFVSDCWPLFHDKVFVMRGVDRLSCPLLILLLHKFEWAYQKTCAWRKLPGRHYNLETDSEGVNCVWHYNLVKEYPRKKKGQGISLFWVTWLLQLLGP